MSLLSQLIVDKMNYLFWFAVVAILRSVQALFLTLAPDSYVKAEIVEFLQDDCHIKVTMRDGDTKKSDGGVNTYDRTKYDCEIIVNNPKFFKRLAMDDFLATGEAYMEGWIDCDDLDKLTSGLAKGSAEFYPIVKWILYAMDQFHIATNNQTREKAYEVVDEHYNLGNDLYQLMLDPTMNYTCAYWGDDTKTLEEAQKNKMDLIARKLNLKPGMKVLDIGCGFGPMAKYLAQHYGASVTCYNISVEQVKYARENCKGLDVTIIEEDYRNATGQYDRIYSIGFFEAVGVNNFREYFEVVNRCLKDDGLTLLHSITSNKNHPYNSRSPRWFTTYIFPGGELPITSDYVTYCEDLFTVEDVQSLQRSYTKTLYAWHKNFNDNWDKLKDQYAHQQGGKFFRMWNFYLLSCAAAFDTRMTQLHQIVYSKHGRKEEYKFAR